MRSYSEYPNNVKNLIDKFDSFFVSSPVQQKEFVMALGFLISKYKYKGGDNNGKKD